jgi:hypothetical protein
MSLSSVAFAFGVFLLVPSGWASATEKHSGTIVEADETQITIEEMGSWHGPTTQPIRRTFRWNDSTRIALAERRSEGEDGWRWGFGDKPGQPSDLQIGDFVTVTLEPRGAHAVAVEVLIVGRGTHLEVPGSS